MTVVILSAFLALCILIIVHSCVHASGKDAGFPLSRKRGKR
jgi:hypothetical protein